ncbi:conjugal transfer protein TraF [Shewanella sp. UCD-KL12]|uniref:conjugal transfer protein TraF n=1 Tax=Shewanella sp. UCD-KL12 TaxID=1917163 RepID=UPI000970C328|nr:conjugal transfer protein TraF [Shewanella sp. UCD-KL12]
MKLLVFLTCLFACIFCSSVFSGDDAFYKAREKGWFWHESPPIEEEEPEVKSKVEITQEVIQVQGESEPEMIEINAEWLKDNIPILKMKAINNPSSENLGAFYSAQRIMIDMSSNFATKTTDYFRKEGNFLSEEHRRPTESFMLSNFKRQRQEQSKPVLAKIGMKGGLWFFYSSTCPYCKKQLPLMKILADYYEVNVLYVSLDGGVLPGIPEDNVVYDTTGQVALDFNIQVTPTTVLVSNDGQSFEMIAQGAASLDKIQTQLIANAHTMDWITDEEYQSAQHIRGSNALANGNVAVKASEIDNPTVLLNALKSKIDLSSSPVGTPFNRRTLQK